MAEEPEVKVPEELEGLPEWDGIRTYPGAARYLKVSRSRISQMVKEQKLTAKRIPDSRVAVIKVSELDAVREEWRQEAEARAEALSR